MTETDLESILGETVELIPLPQAYFRLRALLADPVVGADAIADVIATDPALTARLLQIANSAFFGLARKVDTVSRAISVVGNEEIHSLALAISAVRSFSALQPELVDITEFWRRSVHCAVIARRLGMRLGNERGERLFVAGMLHGIGHIVLCQLQPEPMRELINDSGDRRPIAERQRERFGFDYADLGAGLLARWNLPESLCGAVQFHTRPAQADGTGLAAAWVHIASVLTESAAWAPGTAEPPEMDPVAFQITGIAVEAIEGILEEADEQVAAAVSFLVPDAPASARRELNVAESALA